MDHQEHLVIYWRTILLKKYRDNPSPYRRNLFFNDCTSLNIVNPRPVRIGLVPLRKMPPLLLQGEEILLRLILDFVHYVSNLNGESSRPRCPGASSRPSGQLGVGGGSALGLYLRSG
ncbi:MAG: hypothetical protein A4E53_02686 [Pelotomaculum sp. PtaB.Bin104]|nr:MAG: hypothetical protein A4E53_02686 [Pelotomaculum sp. PtaB.Bin104]